MFFKTLPAVPFLLLFLYSVNWHLIIRVGSCSLEVLALLLGCKVSNAPVECLMEVHLAHKDLCLPAIIWTLVQ